MQHFQNYVDSLGLDLKRRNLSTLQVNIGKLCNQTCGHCHVNAGPRRTENMTRATVERILQLIDACPSTTLREVDITGGAPELNPNFKFFVSELVGRGLQVIDRCNLTVLFEPGQEETLDFLATYKVKVVASLPCYIEENVEAQRGNGVFQKSIKALQELNKVGYGSDEGSLELDLVYNPLGAHLAPPSEELEGAYKSHLWQHFGITFQRLLTMNNMPINRYVLYLKKHKQYDDYMKLLRDRFNQDAASHIMCRDLISISYDGKIYDCDFNQMLSMTSKAAASIWDIASFDDLNLKAPICFADHCFACTAGAGSSCSGALV